MFKFAASALLASCTLAALADYKDNGATWTGICATGKEQSPIDLTTDTKTSDKMQIMGYDYYDFPILNGSLSKTDKTYTTTFTNEAQRKKAEF